MCTTKIVPITLVAVLLVLAVATASRAFEICFRLGNAGNKFRFEVTPVGNHALLSGREATFADRAIIGSAYLGQNNTVRLGFTMHAVTGTESDIHFNAVVTLDNLQGTYTGWRDAYGDRVSGTFFSTACGPLSPVGLSDVATAWRK